MGRAACRLHEYQGVLASDPNRFNALLSVGRAAENLSERDVGANFYRTLLANCSGADGTALEELRHVRAEWKNRQFPSSLPDCA